MIAPRSASEALAGAAVIMAFTEPEFAAAFAIAAVWIEWLEYVGDRDGADEA